MLMYVAQQVTVSWFLKKNLNASRPSEHPRVREKNWCTHYILLSILAEDRTHPNVSEVTWYL